MRGSRWSSSSSCPTSRSAAAPGLSLTRTSTSATAPSSCRWPISPRMPTHSTASARASPTASRSPYPAPSWPRAGAGRTASRSRSLRQAEREDAAASGSRLDPDLAAVALEDLAADGEADPAPGDDRAPLEAPKHREDLVALVGRHAGPVVGDADDPLAVPLLRRDLDVAGPELRGVADEVLEDLAELR